MPIFFSSFWLIPIYFLLFGNNIKSLLCKNSKQHFYSRNGITENFSGFETEFSKPRYTLIPVIVPCVIGAMPIFTFKAILGRYQSDNIMHPYLWWFYVHLGIHLDNSKLYWNIAHFGNAVFCPCCFRNCHIACFHPEMAKQWPVLDAWGFSFWNWTARIKDFTYFG